MTPRFVFPRLMLILGLWSLLGPVLAQDNTLYTVHVGPEMQLRALGGPRTATHPMTAANVTFANQNWQAKTSSGTGSTVQFQSDHAFHNPPNAIYKRDVRLQLTQISGTASSGWQFDTVADTTNYAAGDETATVEVSCRRPGNAIIKMNVIFITGNLATLMGGQYQMTVVGTISEN